MKPLCYAKIFLVLFLWQPVVLTGEIATQSRVLFVLPISHLIVLMEPALLKLTLVLLALSVALIPL